MKKIIALISIAVSLSASAMEVARIQNNDGGYILFVARSCGGVEGSYSAYTYGMSNSDVTSGCFRYAEGAFWVVWGNSNQMKRYPASMVTWNPKFLEVMNNNAKNTF